VDASVANGNLLEVRSTPTLFVNGRRAPRARTPNTGSFFTMVGERFSDQPVQFKFKPGDIKGQWANEPDAEVVAFEKWTDFRQHIRSVFSESNVVQLSGSAASHTHEAGARFFVENTPDSLDTPGEWYLDRRTQSVLSRRHRSSTPTPHTLVYYPAPGALSVTRNPKSSSEAV